MKPNPLAIQPGLKTETVKPTRVQFILYLFKRWVSKGGSFIKGTFLSDGVENGDCEATRVQFILSVSIPGFFSKGGSDIKGFFLPWVFKGVEDTLRGLSCKRPSKRQGLKAPLGIPKGIKGKN